jgi:hypothetical protein
VLGSLICALLISKFREIELVGTMARLIGVILLFLMAMLIYVPQVRAENRSMALDGSWSMCPHAMPRICFSRETVASLTTTHANDVLVLVAQSKFGGNKVTSVVDDDGHVWRQRAVISGRFAIQEYYAIADSPLFSDRIRVTWNRSYTSAYSSFVVFAVSGANTHNPWAPKFPVEKTGWDGSSVALSAAGPGDFLIVSTAVNDAPPCFTTTNISPFQNIGEIGWGEYGEADYFLTGTGGPKTVSFSCNPYSDPSSFLGDALRGPG